MDRPLPVTNSDTNSAGGIRFDDFELNPQSGEILRHGIPVRIQPQPLRVLQVLLERPGETVSREELRKRIWGDATYVEFDQGLNYCIRQIRVALGDNAWRPLYIETLPKQGYRFLSSSVSAASALSPAPEPPAVKSAPAPQKRVRWWIVAGAFAILAVAAAWTYSTPRPRISSLAVLPLDNLSGDPGQEYFADGMTDELITMLAKSSTLRVVSRTSVMQYKHAHRPLPEIAHALGVDGIIEGSLERSNNRIHMTVQLIDARSDTHLWAESFDRDRSDSASLTGDVARSVAKQLHSAVPPTAAPREVNPEAHDAYLRGRYLWFGDRNEEAGQYFLKATQLQPDYAPAWTGVADYYIAGAVAGNLDPKDSLPRGKEAALTSVALDDSLPQAHVTLCAATFFVDWNFAQARNECERAQELDPGLAETYHLQAKILAALNRHPEAIRSERKAMELNAFTRPWGLVLELNWARQYDAAITEAKARLESTPADLGLLWGLAWAYRSKGMWSEAAQAEEKLLQAQNNPAGAEATAQAFQHGGYPAVVRTSLNYWKAQAAHKYVSPVYLSGFTAELDEREETLELLEKGCSEHSPLLLDIQYNPSYDFLRNDARYRSILAKVGLPATF